MLQSDISSNSASFKQTSLWKTVRNAAAIYGMSVEIVCEDLGIFVLIDENFEELLSEIFVYICDYELNTER